MHISRRLFISLMLIPQYLLVQLLKQHPALIETYYSNGIYPYISGLMQQLFSWVPFSVGDVLYAIFIVTVLFNIYKQRHEFKRYPTKQILKITQVISVLYFLFHVLWGLNYYRPSLHSKMNLEVAYSNEDLVKTVNLLLDQTNTIHRQLSTNDSLMVTFKTDRETLFNNTYKGYEALKNTNTFEVPYLPKRVKASLLSLPLTYMGFSGYLNPFTHEAQVDDLMPLFNTPLTAAHEMAHQLGYAAENEANFIGFLATVKHPDPVFNLSGYGFALRYCLNELYYRDKAQFEALYKQINPGVIKHFKIQSQFWASYENPFEPLFKFTYSNYLKANNQKKGIKSYNEVVALIVNYTLR